MNIYSNLHANDYFSTAIKTGIFASGISWDENEDISIEQARSIITEYFNDNIAYTYMLSVCVSGYPIDFKLRKLGCFYELQKVLDIIDSKSDIVRRESFALALGSALLNSTRPAIADVLINNPMRVIAITTSTPYEKSKLHDAMIDCMSESGAFRVEKVVNHFCKNDSKVAIHICASGTDSFVVFSSTPTKHSNYDLYRKPY